MSQDTSRLSLEKLLQSLHEFVLVLDSDGVIQGVWSSNQTDHHDPKVSLLGRRLSEILDRKTYERLGELSQRTVHADRSQNLECSAEFADGMHYFSVRALALAVPGRTTARCLLARDITHRKSAMEGLQKNEALLAQAEQLANIGSWEHNLDTREIVWSEQLYRALQLDPGLTPLTEEFLWQLVHPDDRERVRRNCEKQTTHPQPYEHEARWIRADGRIRTLYTRGVPVIDSSGRTIRIVGMSQDITERREAEDRLRESEALLAQAEQLANFGSWGFDLKTRKPILSKHLLQMYGIASEAEWTEEMYWERLHPKDCQVTREIGDRALTACKPYEYVSRYLASDGRVRIHFVRGVPILGADGKPERAIGFVQDITDQTRAEEDLRRLSQELIRARDEDRRHMARELHESAGQSLAALKMTLGRLEESLPQNSELARELLQSSIELAEGAIREVRTISYLMHPHMLDEAGLGPALRWYAKGFAERSGIATALEVPEDFGRESQEIETALFRVVQEALTNVHRYSGSRTVRIRLTRENGQIRAEVQDQGCGLALPSPAGLRQAPPGVGIAGMRERVQQVKGVFEMESAPGMGTTIRAMVPVAPAELLRRLNDSVQANHAEGNQRRNGKHATGQGG